MKHSESKPDDKQSTPFPTKDCHPAASHSTPLGAKKKRTPQEEQLDHGLDETFPASDPVAIRTVKAKKTRS